MTMISELMASGIPAVAAEKLAQDAAASGLTATGSTQAGAFAIASKYSVFGTVAASTGAILPARGQVFVSNGGANTLTLYPPVGSSINALAANAGISIPAAKSAFCISNGLTWGVIVG
jgi:hypothetical protein